MGQYRNFSLATYFIAHAAARATEEELEKQLGFFEKYLRLDKIYLEPWRGEMVSHEQIELCKRVFARHGISVSGGMTTVIPDLPEGEKKQRLFHTFCYNDPEMLQKLREVSAFMGGHFDEFMLDDFFFTGCTCEKCREERDRFNRAHGIAAGWKDYRLDLMRRVTRDVVIAPAKKVNPNCRVIIKYPNWAESYQETGYNPAGQRELIDGLYTGTETRDPVTTDQHLPRYLSFSLMSYFEHMWPGHNGGGWFDNFDMHITEHYLEQAYLTAFSKPRELMMFCFQSLYDNMYIPALGYQLDKLDALLDHLGTPEGIVCYLPDNAQGEDHVEDALGMDGLPVVTSPWFPEDAPQILLTRSSACDPDILKKLEKYLTNKKGQAIVTSGFWEALSGQGTADLTSIRPSARRVSCSHYRTEERENICLFPRGEKPVTVPVLEFRNNSTWALVKAAHDEESYGLLFRDFYGGGTLYTLTIPDALPDLDRYPAEVLSRIRQEFPVRGVWLEGPSRISLFLYDQDTLVLYPYVMEGAQRTVVRLHVHGATALAPLPEGKEVQPLYTQSREGVFELRLLPGRYAGFKIVR